MWMKNVLKVGSEFATVLFGAASSSASVMSEITAIYSPSKILLTSFHAQS
jgi:hypothetical protein